MNDIVKSATFISRISFTRGHYKNAPATSFSVASFPLALAGILAFDAVLGNKILPVNISLRL